MGDLVIKVRAVKAAPLPGIPPTVLSHYEAVDPEQIPMLMHLQVGLHGISQATFIPVEPNHPERILKRAQATAKLHGWTIEVVEEEES